MEEITYNRLETSEFTKSLTGVSIPGTWPAAPQPPAPSASQGSVVITVPTVTPTSSTSTTQKR